MEAAQIKGSKLEWESTERGGDRDRVETLQDEQQPELVSPDHAGAEEIPSEDEVVNAPVDLPLPTKAVIELEQPPEVDPQVIEAENEDTVNGNNTGTEAVTVQIHNSAI